MLVPPAEIDTLADWLRKPQISENQDIALQFEEHEVTYAELARNTEWTGRALIGQGVKTGERVAILDKNSHRYVEILLGCGLIGAAPVGINWRLAAPEIAYILNDCQASVLFCGRDFAELVPGIQGQLQHLKTIIATDFEHAEWQNYDNWRANAPKSVPVRNPQSQDTMLQLYTSGTTGRPKGAELSHANFVTALRGMIQDGWFDWDSHSVNLVCMPLFHIAGTNWVLLGLMSGARNIIMRDVDPGAILQTIGNDKVSHSIFVPAIILFLMQHPELKHSDLSSLKQIAYGASPIPEELLKQAMAAFQCDFIQVYGLTETSGYTTHMPPADHREGGTKLRSCGRANAGVEIAIRDADGRDLPDGEIGEIVTRAGSVMKGYWNLPEQSAKTLKDGWLYTGDAGYRDSDGYIYIHDRIKDMIVSGGENIYPAEIESALYAHPDIADIAIIGIPDEKWGESVHAVVVLAQHQEALSLEDLQTFARKQLAGYKIPRSLEFIEALPRNPSGKILRRQLRDKYWKGKERQVS